MPARTYRGTAANYVPIRCGALYHQHVVVAAFIIPPPSKGDTLQGPAPRARVRKPNNEKGDRAKLMIKHGEAPFLECSSKGDKRFSAFYARVELNGKTDSIENHYQAAKVFADGTTGLSWREAKGKHPINYAFVAYLYARLWDRYIAEHPVLLLTLKAATGLSDIFGQPGRCCQAIELWRIRNCSLSELVSEQWSHYDREVAASIRASQIEQTPQKR